TCKLSHIGCGSMAQPPVPARADRNTLRLGKATRRARGAAERWQGARTQAIACSGLIRITTRSGLMCWSTPPHELNRAPDARVPSVQALAQRITECWGAFAAWRGESIP